MIFACALAISLMGTQPALAMYSNPSVKTIAQVRTDASMHVVEHRSYKFDDEYAAIKWPFGGITEKQEVTISAVRLTQIDESGTVVADWVNLEQIPFQTDWRELMQSTQGLADGFDRERAEAESVAHSADKTIFPKSNTYAFDNRQNALYVFLANTSDNIVVECDYVIKNAALVYNDIAEIYWDYASPQQDIQTNNLHVQIQLPVAEGSVVIPGETVAAWGHGPEGSVAVNVDGTITYNVPFVSAGQYAQAHVLFPEEWLSNIPVTQKLDNKGMREDDALKEEANWTDSYSAQRINGFSMDIFFLVVCIIVLLAATALFVKYGRERTPEQGLSEDDKKAAELCKCYPAVIMRLIRWNMESASDFTLTVKELARKGIVQIVEDARDPNDVRFRLSPKAKSANKTPLEQETLKIIFDLIGDDYQSVSLSSIERFCDGNREEMRNAMGLWQLKLTSEVNEAKIFDFKSKKVSKALFVTAIVMVIVGIAILLSGQTLPGVAAILVGVIAGEMGYITPRRTPLGIGVAKLAEQQETGSQGVDSQGTPSQETPSQEATPNDGKAEWEFLMTAAIERAVLG